MNARKTKIRPIALIQPSSADSHQPGKVLRLVFLEVLLPHEERLETPLPIVGRSVVTPLLQPLQLRRIVEVFGALRFDDPDFRVGALDEKVRVVVGDAPVCISVFHAELRALGVFDEGDDVPAAVQKHRHVQLETAIANDFIEHRPLGNEESVIFHQMRARFAQLIVSRISVLPLS